MNELGKQQSIHKPARLKQIMFLFFALFFFGIFAFVTVIIFRESNDANSNAIFLTGVLTIPLGLLFVWGFSKALQNKLVIYENGLIYINGKVSEIVLWDEIESVYEVVLVVVSYGIITRNYFYALRTKDYRELKFEPSLKNLQQAGERLKIEAEKRHIPIIGGSIEANPLIPIPR